MLHASHQFKEHKVFRVLTRPSNTADFDLIKPKWDVLE